MSLRALAIVGFDHAPLILDDGSCSVGFPRFQFDASWLQVEGFTDLMVQKISAFLSSNRRSFGPMDDWQQCSYFLHRFLRGWSKNHYAESRRDKARLAAQIGKLDDRADISGLFVAEWQIRYGLEEALLGIHR